MKKRIIKSLLFIILLLGFQTQSLAIPRTECTTYFRQDTSQLINLPEQDQVKVKRCFIDHRENFFAHKNREEKESEIDALEIHIGLVNLLGECVYEDTSSDLEISFEKIIEIDKLDNNNCSIDTDLDKCHLALEKEKIADPIRTQRKIEGQNYGCYAGHSTPKFFKEVVRNIDPSSNIQVLDINQGLISNRNQQSVLKNIIQTEQGGPIVGLINFIIDYLVSIVFVLCMASLIYGGYNLMFAGLDSEMVEKGKNAIKYAIFGFVFIMLSYTIVILVQSLI